MKIWKFKPDGAGAWTLHTGESTGASAVLRRDINSVPWNWHDGTSIRFSASITIGSIRLCDLPLRAQNFEDAKNEVEARILSEYQDQIRRLEEEVKHYRHLIRELVAG